MNSRPGVCDECGVAVVRFHEELHKISILLKEDLKIDGHTYKEGRLIKVRCYRHGSGNGKGSLLLPASMEAGEAAVDAFGGSGEHKGGAFTCHCVEGARIPPCCERETAVRRALRGEFDYLKK